MAAKKGATPAIQALDRAGLTYRTHTYDFDDSSGRIGLQAAVALNVEPARLLKCVMLHIEGGGRNHLANALLASDREIDLKAVARALAAKRTTVAELTAAERATGYVKGGISPFGQKNRHLCLLDEAALAFETILVNGGRRGLQIELSPRDLAAALKAVLAPIGR
ncbi:MAG: YbaK/EbsC family protein [Geminicoccaceae bacterium]